MQVNFGNSAQTVKLPPLKPVNVETNPTKTTKEQYGCFLNTTREVWKDTLKIKANAESYTAGFFKGIKNSLIAVGALVGVDWLVTSGINIGKAMSQGNAIKQTFKTLEQPFALLGKAIMGGAKFLANACSSNPIKTLGSAAKGVLWTLPKKIMNAKGTLSPVARYGFLPLIPLIIGYTTFRSYLRANEAEARIDHRYKGDVGHK